MAQLDRKKLLDIGRKEGRAEGLREILSWLQFKYLEDEDRPDRGTPEAIAILTLATEAGKFIKTQLEETEK